MTPSMEFLTALFGPKPSGLIEIRSWPESNRKHIDCSFFKTVAEAEGAVRSAVDAQRHVFVGVAPRSKRSGKREAITALAWLWADIDHTDTLPQYALPPTLVVRSGHGYHFYWQLDTSAQPTQAEGAMKLLQKSIGADPLWDAPRIMRVPSTFNWKTTPPVECTLLDHEPQAIYSLDDLRFASRFNKKLLPAVYSDDAENFSSRSERDWAIVNEFKRAGVSDGGIHTVFALAPCGDKFRTEGEHYLTQTLTKAAGESERQHSKRGVADESDADANDESGFFEKGQETYMRTEKSVYRVATFRVEPRALIEHSLNGESSTGAMVNDSLAATLHTADKSWPVTLTKKAFSNVAAINAAMPQASAVWTGTDRQIREYLSYLMEKLRANGMQHMRATSTLGRHSVDAQPVWIGTEQTVKAAAVLTANERDVYYLKNGREGIHTHYEFPTKAEVAQVLGDLFPAITTINRPDVTLPVLGWYFASVFKPVLLESGVRFPHLNIFGTRGSGKSSFIKLMLRLLGVADPRSFDAGTTPFVLLSLLGSTNAVPLSLTEFRLDTSPRLARMLLISYDSGRDARGNADQTTTEYAMTAPLVIDGEDGVADPATKERTIMVRLIPETILPDTTEHKAFGTVSRLPIERIAGHYVQHSLGLNAKAVKALFDKSLKQINSEFVERRMPDRIANNVAVVNMGLAHLQCWLKNYGVKFDVPAPREAFKQIVDNVVEASGRTTLLVDEFVEAIINQAALTTARIPFICGYDAEENTLELNIASCYAWWASERRRQNRPMLGIQAIRTQLDERQSEYVAYNGDTVLIDIALAVQYGLDVPKKLDDNKIYIIEPE